MPIITVIIPTYNSEKTLGKSLQSIRKQRGIDQRDIEILVIDGGSSDDTINIAKKHDAKILDNPARMPEAAKEIGIREANGKWGMFLDSDEVLMEMDSLSRRLSFAEKHPEIEYIATAGIISDKSAPGVVRYANRVGDPFSNFVYYSYNGNDRIACGKKRYRYKDFKENAVIFYYGKGQMLPLYDAAGSMFDLKTVKEAYYASSDKCNFVATIFDNICGRTRMSALLYGDVIKHIPDMNAEQYRRKLKWRVNNNVYGSDTGVGFATRRQFNRILSRRQYLYIPYCITILPPILKSIQMAVTEKEVYYLTHFLWSEYVFLLICYHVFRKKLGLGIKKDLSYGK